MVIKLARAQEIARKYNGGRKNTLLGRFGNSTLAPSESEADTICEEVGEWYLRATSKAEQEELLSLILYFDAVYPC